uniref:Nuclear receptor n=1 Tax=Caenorhabditis tropicalis TaxID=1561998 RepID=A0A1I7T5C3_9PELO
MKNEWSTSFFHQSQTPNPYPPMVTGPPLPPHSTTSSFFTPPPSLLSHHSSPINQSPMSLHQPIPLLQSPLKSSPSMSEQESVPSTPLCGTQIKGERCVGCGSDSAIRVHYGASSCHGCKAFFRRSVFEGRVYMCSAENQCDITNESRNRCRACRLRNCLDGGMNPKHVREERSKIERMPGNTCTVSATNGVAHNVPTTSPPQILEQKYSVTLAQAAAAASTLAPSTSTSSFTSVASQPAPVESTTSSGSEAEVVDKKALQESHLTLFMCALEKQTEQLTDDDVKDNDVMGAWSRDISLTFGLQHPQMVIKRLPLMYTCERIMEASDLYLSWYRSFVFNFMAFGWITFAYKCFELKQHEVGIPLGNGSFIPYNDEEQKKLPERWALTYGVVCKKLIDLIVKAMIELQISEEEYCLIKTVSLFQQDCILSETGTNICSKMRDRLLEALSTHIEKKFPFQTESQRLTRALRISLMLPSFSHIGQVESTLIQQLTAADLHQLSGVPMEICNAQTTL